MSADKSEPKTGGCPGMHGGPANKHWWPQTLDLKALDQHSPRANPFGADFDYAVRRQSL